VESGDTDSVDQGAVWSEPIGSATDALVVEDDTAVAAIVRTALEQAGYQVLVATDVASGRRALGELRPEIVVCDIDLPDGNGLDLVREMRALPAPPGRIVVLSGGAREIAAVAALDAGAHDFLAKPFSPRELVARLELR